MIVWQWILHFPATYIKGVFLLGANADVNSRRLDTDDILEKVLQHDKEAFGRFYERYRGRVYRFFARQYGTSEYGKAAYYSAWRHLVVAGLNCETPKDLKLSFYQYLGKSVPSLSKTKSVQAQTNYLPRDIEQDSNWGMLLIEHFKCLNAEMKRYFLFKHEIGISEAAIAAAFDVNRVIVDNTVKEAERTLSKAMEESGCPKKLTLEKLYRQSRVVKPPVSWDNEILDSFLIWLQQADLPEIPDEDSKGLHQGGGLAEKWTNLREQVKSKLSSRGKRSSLKGSKLFSSHH